jgi:hypothetical protein
MVRGRVEAHKERLRDGGVRLGVEAAEHLEVDHGALAGGDGGVQWAGTQHQLADHAQPLGCLARVDWCHRDRVP